MTKSYAFSLGLPRANGRLFSPSARKSFPLQKERMAKRFVRTRVLRSTVKRQLISLRKWQRTEGVEAKSVRERERFTGPKRMLNQLLHQLQQHASTIHLHLHLYLYLYLYLHLHLEPPEKGLMQKIASRMDENGEPKT